MNPHWILYRHICFLLHLVLSCIMPDNIQFNPRNVGGLLFYNRQNSMHVINKDVGDEEYIYQRDLSSML